MLELLFEFWKAHSETLTMLSTYTTLIGGLIAIARWIWEKLNEYFYL